MIDSFIEVSSEISGIAFDVVIEKLTDMDTVSTVVGETLGTDEGRNDKSGEDGNSDRRLVGKALGTCVGVEDGSGVGALVGRDDDGTIVGV